MDNRNAALSAAVCAAGFFSACGEEAVWVPLDAGPGPPPPAWDAAPPVAWSPRPVPPPPPAPYDPCATVFCSGRGTCERSGTQAWCRCEPGFISEGVLCEEDRDRDGLSEYREFQLALEYAPMLRFAENEYFEARMTHWAATRTSDGSTVIFYALSYFEDGGATEFGVNPHLGDSEFIVTVIPTAGRARYFLSAHYETYVDSSRWVDLDGFEFDRSFPGTHPIVYVAVGKHANYPSVAACNAGSFGFDKCDFGHDEVVQVLRERNLGQSWAPLLDVVVAYADGGHAREWYWTDRPFCGWLVPSDEVSDRTDCVPPANTYARQLRAWFM